MIMTSNDLWRVAALWFAISVCGSNGGEAALKEPARPPAETDSLWMSWSGKPYSVPAAYRKEAMKLILAEANQVAQALQLPERLPIRESDLAEFFLSPLPYARDEGAIGNVMTRNYVYSLARANKLCYVIGTHQLDDCVQWEKNYLWPLSRVDTNAAYQMATQWLSAASMDVAALNRDFHLSIKTDTVYTRPPPGKFVPVYSVAWCKPYEPIPGVIFSGPNPKWESVASVSLFLPTKTLIQLRVEDPKYILRPTVTSTNLDAFLVEPKRE